MKAMRRRFPYWLLARRSVQLAGCERGSIWVIENVTEARRVEEAQKQLQAQVAEQLLFQQLQITPQFAGVYYGNEDGTFVYVMRSPDGPQGHRGFLSGRAEQTGQHLIGEHRDRKQV